jgi:hypothetical protein
MIRKLLSGLLIASLILNGWLPHTRAIARAEVASLKAAQSDALVEQINASIFPAEQSTKIARKSDDEAAALYEAGRRAGADYADSHRVRADACPASDTHLPGADRPAEGDNRFAGWVPDDMVAISRPDFDACTAAGTRLIQVHQAWQELKAAGVAVASDPEDGE